MAEEDVRKGRLRARPVAGVDSAAAPVGLRPLGFAAARDGWLPIERCSRRIVPQLERAGYEVRYREFDGGHVVPPEIGREAAD